MCNPMKEGVNRVEERGRGSDTEEKQGQGTKELERNRDQER